MLGRFMGIDPVGVNETNLHSHNRYAYGNNNPYKFVDPDGRDSVAVFWGGTLPNEGSGKAQTQFGWMQFSNDAGKPYATIPIHSGYSSSSGNENVEGKGRTPSGDYKVKEIRPPFDKKHLSSFEDKAGTAPWYAPLIPITSMPNEGERNERCTGGSCGIHADGNGRGTAGCQGIANPDTKNTKNMLEKAIKNSGGSLPVHVE